MTWKAAAASRASWIAHQPRGQPGTRSIMVYVRVDNPDARLRAGMFAQGALVLGRHAGVAAVPATAVRSDGERAFVYSVENDVLAERQVKLGIRDDESGLVEIASGLAAGAKVVRNTSRHPARRQPRQAGQGAGAPAHVVHPPVHP
ncbi:efflux RND transporter periplasmic adaptor subunit [Cupriavidus basilensis]